MLMNNLSITNTNYEQINLGTVLTVP